MMRLSCPAQFAADFLIEEGQYLVFDFADGETKEGNGSEDGQGESEGGKDEEEAQADFGSRVLYQHHAYFDGKFEDSHH